MTGPAMKRFSIAQPSCGVPRLSAFLWYPETVSTLSGLVEGGLVWQQQSEAVAAPEAGL